MNKLIFFGSDECPVCIQLKELIFDSLKDWFRELDCELVFVDAFDSKNDPFCDEHGVDDLPHVKLYKDNELVFNKIGFFSPRILKRIIEK